MKSSLINKTTTTTKYYYIFKNNSAFVLSSKHQEISLLFDEINKNYHVRHDCQTTIGRFFLSPLLLYSRTIDHGIASAKRESRRVGRKKNIPWNYQRLHCRSTNERGLCRMQFIVQLINITSRCHSTTD